MNYIIKASNLLHFILYADDTSVFSSSHDINTLVNTLYAELTSICAWLEANHLSLNSDGISYLIILRRKPIAQDISSIFVNGNADRRANDAKFLGVMVDEKISFRSHADYIVTKLSKYIYVFYIVRQFIRVIEIVQIYYTLIYPHLIYCITVWDGSYESILKSVMVLQGILCAICSTGFRASADPICQRLKALKLEEIYRYMVGAYVFKTLNSDMSYVFEYRDQTEYVTRESVLHLLKGPRVTSVQSTHSLKVS